MMHGYVKGLKYFVFDLLNSQTLRFVDSIPKDINVVQFLKHVRDFWVYFYTDLGFNNSRNGSHTHVVFCYIEINCVLINYFFQKKEVKIVTYFLTCISF